MNATWIYTYTVQTGGEVEAENEQDARAAAFDHGNGRVGLGLCTTVVDVHRAENDR